MHETMGKMMKVIVMIATETHKEIKNGRDFNKVQRHKYKIITKS